MIGSHTPESGNLTGRTPDLKEKSRYHLPSSLRQRGMKYDLTFVIANALLPGDVVY
uniref:Uncharacterized protein n=1 Tax=Utricularia reniformis TaxID=192314 RepID=A0A1Y0B2U9_9LAMI|nr:hypothetical protein AEK19_MT1582 [Utricularia reniformis]ART31766.1 hypothetical protein AEK19_MT1582 [Utricularia reniformis]